MQHVKQLYSLADYPPPSLPLFSLNEIIIADNNKSCQFSS
jgi:hypothetical protein